MRKFTWPVSAAALMFILSVAWAADETTKPDNVVGNLQVSEKSWDFGYIPKGAAVTHKFVLKNVGSKPMKIVSVRPACGCTSAPLIKSDLGPGESTDLEVTFNARSYQGKVNKSVAITTDDSASQVAQLTFSTDVGGAVPTLVFDPQDVNFDTVAVGQKASKKIKITNNDIQPITLRLVEVPDNLVDAKLRRDKLNIGDVDELSVNLTNKNKIEGYFSKTLTLEVNGHVSYRVSLPLSGTLLNTAKKN